MESHLKFGSGHGNRAHQLGRPSDGNGKPVEEALDDRRKSLCSARRRCPMEQGKRARSYCRAENEGRYSSVDLVAGLARKKATRGGLQRSRSTSHSISRVRRSPETTRRLSQ